MAKKSIWQQITNPRQTYVDGYGTQREVEEPRYITKGRAVYQTINEFAKPGENITLVDPETGEIYNTSVNSSSGLLMDVFDPAGAIGKVDDVAKLVKNLDSVKDKWDALRKYKLHRKRLSTKGASKHIFKNAERMYGDLSKLDADELDGVTSYINDKLYGDYNRYLDILWERGDLDGIKHPKMTYSYEDLPF